MKLDEIALGRAEVDLARLICAKKVARAAVLTLDDDATEGNGFKRDGIGHRTTKSAGGECYGQAQFVSVQIVYAIIGVKQDMIGDALSQISAVERDGTGTAAEFQYGVSFGRLIVNEAEDLSLVGETSGIIFGS